MLIYVLYDGIQNSVFDGQVLQPIAKKIQNKSIHRAIIISFEKKAITPELIAQKLQHLANKEHIKIITLKRPPYFGKLSLVGPIIALRKLLRQVTPEKPTKNYKVIARGPIAGYICSKTIDFTTCSSFIIQARGLVGQEYKYSANHTSSINHLNFDTKQPPPLLYRLHNLYKPVSKKMIAYTRYWQFQRLEKTVYKKVCTLPNAQIESVSLALQKYLIKQFKVDPQKIHIAHNDIPTKLDTSITTRWRTQIRHTLDISKNATIYCYSGSIKPWQCPEQVMIFFKQQLKSMGPEKLKIPPPYLLILTQNTKEFEILAHKHTIPHKNYGIITVPHKDIYQYLSACDYGIIFREQSIVNWVSRPTKILEYQSVGLTIIHNNTIAFLTNK